ncbi:hypothetical protein CYLTODRAFT_51884 [Cylindrobasidium torrendii FP15055 ss-10]|uniref:Uncharacterized protein n=1 Tax=Cylindrobasidium torrendii FP15055 ss-10 TaxID=1314674 RepID=A0A0D7B5N7_9AGAR|nr:hypothetical protein CYLTODRAFT_51884 [Cylindrobasidium torrendii FP15055 ss-10]
MSLYSPPTTPPGQRRVKPLPKRQRTPPSTSPAPLAVQDYYVPLISSLLEETRNEGGNAKKRKVPHAIGGEVQGRVSRITAAGIQFRESVRVRRKHLEGLIEEGEGDTIEKALMLGLLGPGDRDGKRRRLSKRLVLRAGRCVPRGQTEPLKTCENFQFTYSVPSQATDKLRETRQAVDLLRRRIAAAPPPKKKPPATTSKALPAPPLPPSSNKKKKKKRSALANASNPHHLRNYVPSRVPGVEQPTATTNSDFVPVRFLTADIPPKRRSKIKPQPQVGTNEWICAYCEYELFYGGDEEYRRALRRRKKVLKRRQRAREKAARGVAGKGLDKKENEEGAEDDGSEDEEETDAFTDSTAAQRTAGQADLGARQGGYG